MSAFQPGLRREAIGSHEFLPPYLVLPAAIAARRVLSEMMEGGPDLPGQWSGTALRGMAGVTARQAAWLRAKRNAHRRRWKAGQRRLARTV